MNRANVRVKKGLFILVQGSWKYWDEIFKKKDILVKLELYNICSLSKKKKKRVKIKCTDLVLRNVLNSSGRNEMFYAFFATILTIVF